MTIPLVSSNGTNQLWIARTNQAITVVNALTDGALTLNGSVTFSNSTFSLILPSLNVANSIVLTSPSGNSFFLRSSNASINGTAYITGSGNGLYVSNNALIGGNLTVNASSTFNGTVYANNEIVGNADITQAGVDGQLRAVQRNTGVIFRNDGNSFYILQTGNVANPMTAAFNSMQPFTWNLATGVVTIDNSQNGTNIGGDLIINGQGTSLTVANNSLFKGNVTVQNTANLQSGLTSGGLLYANGGIQMSNTAITFDKRGSTFIQYNPADFAGNGALQLSGNIQVNGQMIVTGTATFTNTIVIQTATDSSLNIVNSVSVGNNITVVNKVIAGNGIFTDLHSNKIASEGEVVAKLGTYGQFRAVAGNYGVILRNDGFTFMICTTGSVSNPDTAPFNSLRPIQFSMLDGSITIDQTGAGTTFRGNVSIINGGGLTFGTGTVINGSSVVIPNATNYYGKDTGGTARLLLGLGSDNIVNMFIGPGGFWRVLNLTGSSSLFSIGSAGDLTASGGLQLTGSAIIGGNVVIPNGQNYYGRDTGGNARPLVGLDGNNYHTNWLGTGGYWRIINASGTQELVKVSSDGTFYSLGPNMLTIGALTVGTLSPPTGTPGVIAASYGYQAKSAANGGFRANVFNIDWNGGGASIFIDNTLIAFFAAGTNTSDRRIKEQIEDAPSDALKRIRELRSVSYRLQNNELIKNLSEVKQLGYIADELEQVIPEAVYGDKNAVDENGKPIPQTLNLTPIIATATQAITELADKYDALEKRVALLEQQLNR